MRWICLQTAALMGLCLTPGVCAESHDSTEQWYIVGLSSAIDSANGITAGALVDYGWSDKTRLSADIGYTRADTDFDTLDGTQWNVSVEQTFALLGITGRVGQWGDRDAFRANVWSAGVFKTAGPVRVAVAYIHRDLSVLFQSMQDTSRQRTVDVHSEGVSLSASATSESGKALWLRASLYDYNRPVDRLGNLRLASLLAPSALTLSGTLLDDSVSIGADWPVGEKLLSLTAGFDRTATDRQNIPSLTLGWLTPLGQRTELDIGIGASRDREDTQYFVRFLLLRYGLR